MSAKRVERRGLIRARRVARVRRERGGCGAIGWGAVTASSGAESGDRPAGVGTPKKLPGGA